MNQIIFSSAKLTIQDQHESKILSARLFSIFEEHSLFNKLEGNFHTYIVYKYVPFSFNLPPISPDR